MRVLLFRGSVSAEGPLKAVIFRDDFSDTSSEWPSKEGDNGDIVAYADGGYRMYNPPPPGARFAGAEGAGKDIEDVIVEVDATRTSDTPTEPSHWGAYWGVMCRRNGDYNYTMGISNDGRSYIGKHNGGQFSSLADGNPSDAILTEEGATNRIRGECVGSGLTLYVNDQKLLEAVDAEFDSGQVGLFVRDASDEPPATDVLFDNFLADKPSERSFLPDLLAF